MAEDQVGMRKDVLQQLAPWTKLFSAFKVALDPKKLLLAGAGILVMQLGWWFISGGRGRTRLAWTSTATEFGSRGCRTQGPILTHSLNKGTTPTRCAKWAPGTVRTK